MSYATALWWALLALLLCATSQVGSVYVWAEGESYHNSTNFPSTSKDPGLSGGVWEWLTNRTHYTWILEVPFPPYSTSTTTTFNLYARTQSGLSPFTFSVNGGPGQYCDSTRTLDQTIQESISNFVYASWVFGGQVVLTNPSPGSPNSTTTVFVEIIAQAYGALDAFILISDDSTFAPRAQAKPDQLFNQTLSNYFPFQGRIDSFSSTTPTDMSFLNEDVAGAGGRIIVQGDSFVQSNTGKKIKFWAVNMGDAHLDPGSIVQMAKQFKKMGFNLVRFHAPITYGKGLNWAVIDNTTLYDLFFMEHTLKQYGIYMSLSVYWYGFFDFTGTRYPGNPGVPYGLLFFNTEVQTAFDGILQTLLNTPNPYEGGLTLAEDPAVAFLSVMNEDSLLFWTLGAIPVAELDILMTDFATYFSNKYGSPTAALIQSVYGAAQGTTEQSQPDALPSMVALRDIYTACIHPDARGHDTLDFLTQQMKTYYTTVISYIKNTLGFKGLVHGSNWMTICEAVNPLDKYANLPGDYLDRHGYFGGFQNGTDNGYRWSAGDYYTDQSALKFQPVYPSTSSNPDYSNPFNDIIYNGYPSTISEVDWVAPDKYRADFPLVAASYASLQGTDGVYLFAASTIGWLTQDGKFQVQLPVIYPQVPLAAYIYRSNLIDEGDFAIKVAVTYDQLLNVQMPPFANQNFTSLRAQGIAAGGNITNVSSIDPLSFYVGRVEVDIDQGGVSWGLELSPYIDRVGQTVTSITGQMNWNWGQGVLTVNASAVQAVAGFLSAIGSVTLKDVTISSGMDYGAITIVAIDGNPISQSNSILICVTSENLMYNFSATATSTPSLQRIKWLGTTPVMVKNFSGTITFASRSNWRGFTLNALDENGYLVNAHTFDTSSGQFTLYPSTFYYHLSNPSASKGSRTAPYLNWHDLLQSVF